MESVTVLLKNPLLFMYNFICRDDFSACNESKITGASPILLCHSRQVSRFLLFNLGSFNEYPFFCRLSFSFTVLFFLLSFTRSTLLSRFAFFLFIFSLFTML